MPALKNKGLKKKVYYLQQCHKITNLVSLKKTFSEQFLKEPLFTLFEEHFEKLKNLFPV